MELFNQDLIIVMYVENSRVYSEEGIMRYIATACMLATSLLGVEIASAAPVPAPSGAILASADGRDALDSVKFVEPNAGSLGMGRVFLHNQCRDEVELFWCYSDGSSEECATDRGNLWTIGAGKAWPVNPDRQIFWAACHGANTLAVERGSSGRRFSCSVPIGNGSDNARVSNSGRPSSPYGTSASVPPKGNQNAAIGSSPDATSTSNIAVQPRQITPMGVLITPDDYPPISMRNEEQGTVTYKALIAENGVPSTCEIIVSSGYQFLDEKTCQLILARGRFEPGRTADGKARQTYVVQKVTWSLP